MPVIVRSHYVGRTFIASTQPKRVSEVAQKFAFTESEINGKSIVVVDDSIVRGTTMPKVVSELRRCGAKAIHVRIACPPIMHPCFYGINTPTQAELISASRTPTEICELVGADSLEFLSLETLQGLSGETDEFCFACMNGKLLALKQGGLARVIHFCVDAGPFIIENLDPSRSLRLQQSIFEPIPISFRRSQIRK